MKRVKLTIYQDEINKLVGKEFEIVLNDGATVVDAIIEVDKRISTKGIFPVKEYHSILHMVYNPVENRIYDHIIMAAFSESQPFINVKREPGLKLSEGTKVKILLKDTCGDIIKEKVIDYETFSRAMLEKGYKVS
jgi:hypothetical protein